MDAPYYSGCGTESSRRKIIVPYESEQKVVAKWCYRCRRFKLYDDFYRKAVQYDGYSSECKLCDHTLRVESRRKKQRELIQKIVSNRTNVLKKHTK